MGLCEACAGKLWSREKLMAHAAGVVVAGMDTTAHAVSWALYAPRSTTCTACSTASRLLCCALTALLPLPPTMSLKIYCFHPALRVTKCSMATPLRGTYAATSLL